MHRREIEIDKLGEGVLILGFYLIHLFRGSFSGFSSPLGFPRINMCLYCDCVSFSDYGYAFDVKLD